MWGMRGGGGVREDLEVKGFTLRWRCMANNKGTSHKELIRRGPLHQCQEGLQSRIVFVRYTI